MLNGKIEVGTLVAICSPTGLYAPKPWRAVVVTKINKGGDFYTAPLNADTETRWRADGRLWGRKGYGGPFVRIASIAEIEAHNAAVNAEDARERQIYRLQNQVNWREVSAEKRARILAILDEPAEG